MNFENLAYWHWWLLALSVLILELTVAGSFYLLWVAFAAGVVGLVVLVVAPAWQAQFVLFAVLSAVSMVIGHRFRPKPEVSDRPTLNRRGESYVGRVFTLSEPIVNGVGKLRVDDSQWRIAGPDAPAGAKVRVTGVDGTTLKVESAD